MTRRSTTPSRATDSNPDSAPVRFLAIVGVFTVVVLVGLLWAGFDASRRIQEVAMDSLRVQDMRGRIIFLDEALTMSALMAAETGDPMWQVRYEASVTDLDAVMTEAKRLMPQSDAATQSDEANQALVAMESRCFEFVQQGDLAGARAILGSEAYSTLKASYARGMDALGAELDAAAESAIQQQRARAVFQLIAGIAAITLLIVAWGYVIRLNRRATRLRAEGRLRALLDTAPVGILLVDHMGVIRSANEEANRVFLYSPGELEGLSVETLVPASLRGGHVALRDGYFAAPERQIMAKGRSLKGIRKDGSEIFVEVGLAPIELPEGLMIASAIHDITEQKEAEQALARSEERFGLTVRGSGDGLWDHDPATGELWYAERFRELLGYHGEEEYPNVVESWSDGLHPDDRQATLDAFAAHLARDVPYDVEYRLKTKTGEYRWFRARGTSLRDETGRSYRAAGSITDITAQREAQEELQKLSRAVEQSPATVVITDKDGHIEYANPKFTATTGYEVEEVLGKNPSILNSRTQPKEFYEDLWKTIASGNEWSGEFCNKKKSGELYWESASISPIRDAKGEVIYYVAVKDDITERKHMEEQLLEARKAADAANEAKSSFLANMSHEIRTPMNGIIGMTELALDTDLTPEQRDYINTVQSSADALLALINDILDFSKIEAGKLELDPTPFGLRDALADMLNTLATRAHAKGLELIYDVPPGVHDALTGDVYRLRQIIVNLVGNAIKFTEEGEIVVEVDVVNRTEENIELHFAVHDTGVGIPPDRLEAVLRPFEQADVSTTREFGGTGLGLTISIQLAECMGGRLWVESELGRGSTFHFTVVFGIGEAVRRIGLEEQQDLLDGLPVLIVDDNATNRRILGRTVANWRMKAHSVPGAAEALAAMDRAAHAGAPYRLVLSDVNMPAMDGFGLFEQLQQHATHAGVPVILLTSASRPGDVARCREIGVSAHLIKPVKQSLLLNAIMSAVGDSVASPRASTSAVEREASSRTLSILLAEDNPTNQKFAVRAIEKAGHSVVVANNGREAVDALAKTSYDVVLMDIHMPEMDGFEATRTIREREQGADRRTPIIAMTANAMKGDREQCLAVGLDGYVSKPVKRKALFAEIDRVLDASP